MKTTDQDRRFSFTKRAIEKLTPPAEGRVYFYDTKTPGLCVCVTASAAKTFYVYKKVDRRPIRHRLGRIDELTIEQARKEADRFKGQVATGKNPAAIKRAKNGEITFGELHRAWIDQHVRPKRAAKTLHEYERIYNANLKTWAHRRLSEIGSDLVVRLHLRIGAESPYMANRVLSQIRAVFNWARRPPLRLKIDNPAADLEKFDEESRDRFLQVDELRAFFQSLAEEPAADMRDLFLLALLTGARRGNVCAMQWPHVKFERAEWRIPETKNGDAVIVPLSPPAIELLKQREQARNGSEFVFPSREGTKTGHITEPKTAWKRICKRAGLEDLRIHDLRRTLGSWQAKTGASLPIIGKTLGHKTAQATSIYARLDVDPVRLASTAAAVAMLEAAGVSIGVTGLIEDKRN